MSFPDGRQWESPEPAFSKVAEFYSCSQLIDGTGKTVPCSVERIGGYRAGHHATELTDILFGDQDANRFVFDLAPGDYDVSRIVDVPEHRSTADRVYFTMIAKPQTEPNFWEQFPELYGSDAYNMTVISPDCRRRITALIENDSSLWNIMCDMICRYRERSYQEFEALGFRLSSPDGRGGEAVFVPSSKVANFFLGYRANRELVAIQGKWL